MRGSEYVGTAQLRAAKSAKSSHAERGDRTLIIQERKPLKGSELGQEQPG